MFKRALFLLVVFILVIPMAVMAEEPNTVFEEVTSNYTLQVYPVKGECCEYETVINITGQGKMYWIPIPFTGFVTIKVSNDLGEKYLRASYFKDEADSLIQTLPNMTSGITNYFTAGATGRIHVVSLIFRRIPLIFKF